MKSWQILVVVIAAAVLIAGVAYLAFTHPGDPAPEPMRNITLLVYYEGVWHGTLSDAAGTISIGGRDQTGGETRGIQRIRMEGVQGFVDVYVRKDDGTYRTLYVDIMDDGDTFLQKRVTEAPFGVIMFRVPV